MKEELKKSTEKKIILHQWQLPTLIVIVVNDSKHELPETKKK